MKKKTINKLFPDSLPARNFHQADRTNDSMLLAWNPPIEGANLPYSYQLTIIPASGNSQSSIIHVNRTTSELSMGGSQFSFNTTNEELLESGTRYRCTVKPLIDINCSYDHLKGVNIVSENLVEIFCRTAKNLSDSER